MKYPFAHGAFRGPAGLQFVNPDSRITIGLQPAMEALFDAIREHAADGLWLGSMRDLMAMPALEGVAYSTVRRALLKLAATGRIEAQFARRGRAGQAGEWRVRIR